MRRVEYNYWRMSKKKPWLKSKQWGQSMWEWKHRIKTLGNYGKGWGKGRNTKEDKKENIREEQEHVFFWLYEI